MADPEEGAAAPRAAAEVVRDISSSDAFTYLDQLAERGDLTEAQVDLYKSKFAALHDVVLQVFEREQAQVDLVREWRASVREEKIKLERSLTKKEQEAKSVAELERERDRANAERLDADEREAVMEHDSKELKRRESELDAQLRTMRKENADLVQPELKRLNDELIELRDDLARLETTHESLEKARGDAEASVKRVRDEMEAIEAEQATLLAELEKVKGDPARLSKQADNTQTAAEGLRAEMKALESKIAESAAALEAQASKHAEIEKVKTTLDEKLDKHREDIEQRLLDVDAVKNSLALEKARHRSAMERRMELEREGDRQDARLRERLAGVTESSKAYDRGKRELKRQNIMLETVKNALPQLHLQLTDRKHMLASYEAEIRHANAQLRDLRQEVDVFIHQFLRQEGVEAKKKAELEEILAKEEEYEREREMWRAEEAIATKQIATLTAQREIKAREASKAAHNEKATREELQMKGLMVVDLQKKASDVSAQLKEFSALYEVVKNERNTYVNAIQAASQALAEMKEKIKILLNEVEILQNESLAKDKALGKERLAHQTAQVQRDALRLDTNKAQSLYKTKQEQVEQQIVEIDKLNSMINATEREMLALKKRYEGQVEARNYMGIQLIDRNDELCILYEKSNIHEGTLRDGEVSLREREEEIRMLRIGVGEVEREIHVTRKLLPQMPKFAEQILTLQRQLQAEREVTERLCADLETPANKDRWRELPGEDPDEEQLTTRTRMLEERLGDKKEQLLEKELVLEEVTSLSERLRKQAAEGRASTLGLAKNVNEFQARIRDTTRKMMAIVSELSMYQATAMKLQQEKQEREAEVEEARTRLERGEAPSADAEREWYRLEREHLRAAEAAMTRAAVEQSGQMPAASQLTRTTAEPRPNAYIPDDLGIPRPYGSHAPFKPSVAGSTMRHIRAPVQPVISIE